MLKRSKDLLRSVVASLRATLAGSTTSDGVWQRGDLDRELERLGIAPDGTSLPIDALPNATAYERQSWYAAEAMLTSAVNGAKGAAAAQKRAEARAELVERTAYTWMNRLLALRAMESRGLIEETLRSNPEYDGISEALFILRSDTPARTAGTDGGWWAVIEDACAAQAVALPGLFDLSDPISTIRPSTAALLRCISVIGSAPAGYTLIEADEAFADPDAIGWAYQFYQEAAKARVYAKLGSGGKAASRAEIAAATQLFTEPYMVQWLLQNSLGRSYHEAYPDSQLPETWAYYIRQRPEGQELPEAPRPLHALDLIDPCCGSGYFLREAFDMFAAMYREQNPGLAASEVADRVLTRHLHGIDLDPRAAQLAALTLYLRAWEFVRDDARGQRRGAASVGYRPSSLNIATTPTGLSEGSLQRHLRRHPEDRVMKPLLEGIFTALEQADILGSLLRPGEHIDEAIKKLQQTHQIPLDFDTDAAVLRRTITALAQSDPAELKRMLLDRVAQSFRAEAGAADDVAAQLFGREAEGGVRLLQLLDRKYAVVVTNPPYMGSSNMDAPLKKYVELHYKPGKRDLYAAFILRCLELTVRHGRVAMITQQSWMFLRSFAELRAVPEEKLTESQHKGVFAGLLRTTALESLAHLGANAFEEISGEVVQNVMFVLENAIPFVEHRMTAFRLVGPKSSQEKAQLLFGNDMGIVSTPKQNDFLAVPESPLIYYVSKTILRIIANNIPLRVIAEVRPGPQTSDNSRFNRTIFEIHNTQGEKRWYSLSKGGGYKKWIGIQYLAIDWQQNGARIKEFNQRNGDHWSRNVRNVDYLFHNGLTYSSIGRAFACRTLFSYEICDTKGPGIYFTKQLDLKLAQILLNSRLCNYIFKLMNPALDFNPFIVSGFPLAQLSAEYFSLFELVLQTKSNLIATDPNERSFIEIPTFQYEHQAIATLLHTLEGINESEVFAAYGIDGADMQTVLDETGTPAGFHPLVAAYDALPELPADLDLPALPQEVLDYLAAHERIAPSAAELARIKSRLRALYEAGPGAKSDDSDNDAPGDDEGEAAVSGAHIPIPTETFLEELSVKMELHPISIYWLLEELRREGARCKPEEQRLLEDRLSVIVLRLLGHRWPKQIEAGEIVPEWADRDGIIPISGGTGEPTLAERVRARLRAEDGDLGVQRVEALIQELLGMSLEDWIRRECFKRHVRQFKYRPVAWHLASDPSDAIGGGKARGKGKSRNQPAFECMVYYHDSGTDMLARIRTQYVEPLLRAARQQYEYAAGVKSEVSVATPQQDEQPPKPRDPVAMAQMNMRMQELEAFNRRLQESAEQGFACAELDTTLDTEPLDRWSGDGYIAPASREQLLQQERSWRVDINDGVRVNCAPLQLAGVLASDILKAPDAKKALADRARWRADERRWVRAGKLPRCGWMEESVPESPTWTALAPQRELERMKLEEKRRAIATTSETAPDE